MAERSRRIVIWIAIAFLCGQTVLSTTLFGQLHRDGGAWPLLMFIFLTIDLFYARYVIGLLETDLVPWWVASCLTVILSLALLVHGNFWLIFGDDTRPLPYHIRVLHQFFGSPIFPYAFYAAAIFANTLAANWRKPKR
jgi:hypothetical protein